MKIILTILFWSFFANLISACLFGASTMLVTGQSPFPGIIFISLTLIFTSLVVLKCSKWLKKHWLENIGFTPIMLFAFGFTSWLLANVFVGIFLGSATLDIAVFQARLVIARSDMIIGIAIIFAVFCTVYFWFPAVFKRNLNTKLAYLHFWITYLAIYLMFWHIYYKGLFTIPASYLTYKPASSVNQVDKGWFISLTTLLIIAGQMVFAFNFFYSIFKGKKVRRR